MAIECSIKILAKVTGGDKDISYPEAFTVTTTPTKPLLNRQIQASADTAEALNLGGIGTVELVIIKATSNDLKVDTSFSSSFNEEITVAEGEVTIFKPSGTPYIHGDGSNAVTVDYLIIGSA